MVKNSQYSRSMIISFFKDVFELAVLLFFIFLEYEILVRNSCF